MDKKPVLVWAGIFLAIVVPVTVAARSPLLQWREPVYIAAGFAGIAGLAILLLQPLLAGGYLPGIRRVLSRRVHRVAGVLLLSLVLLHVIGLWFTSPPDVIDALLLRSPTPFSVWGVLALWSIVVVALLVLFRRRLPIRPRAWRYLHLALTAVVVTGTIVHALLIQGAMGVISKWFLCALVGLVFVNVAVARIRTLQKH